MSFKKAIGAPLASLFMIFTIFVLPTVFIFFIHEVREQAIEALKVG